MNKKGKKGEGEIGLIILVAMIAWFMSDLWKYGVALHAEEGTKGSQLDGFMACWIFCVIIYICVKICRFFNGE